MHQPAARGHPLDAPGFYDAFVAAAVAVGQRTGEDEGHRLEAAMGMRTKGQAGIVRRIDLGTVVVEEQEGIQMRQAGARQRAAGLEVTDVVTPGGMAVLQGTGGHAGPRGAKPQCKGTSAGGTPGVKSALQMEKRTSRSGRTASGRR